MKKPWQLQTAKAQFSELFRRARTDGPQYVTKAGKETVVVLRAEQFEELKARRREPRSLVDFFRKSPLVGSGINFERETDYGRDIEL
jgi:antitoxin Phd